MPDEPTTIPELRRLPFKGGGYALVDGSGTVQEVVSPESAKFSLNVFADLDRIKNTLGDHDRLLKQIQTTLTKGLEKIMATLADVNAALAALTQKVSDESTVIDSAITAFAGLAKMIADLQAQLAAAIAAGDPTKLQAVADGLTNLATGVDAKKAALAAAIPSGT